jgi:hypothetical protein
LPKEFPGEKLLIKVLDDLADFLPYLILVGGWVPYIYAKYIWPYQFNGGSLGKTSDQQHYIPVLTTTDVDFGVCVVSYPGSSNESIADRVRKLGYGERHVSMDRMYPFVPVVKDVAGDLKAEVEFITDPKVPRKIVNKIVGKEIKINEIEHFSLLLGSAIKTKMDGREIQIPTESMFTFHKLLTFVERQNKEKLKKDLYYVYYMLRFSPKKEQLSDDVVALIKKQKEGKQVKANLKEYFSSVDSKGPLFVEQENGPDAYISNVRQDAFDKFGGIRLRAEE